MIAKPLLRFLIVSAGFYATSAAGGIVIWGNDAVYLSAATPKSELRTLVNDTFTNIISVSSASDRLGIVAFEKGKSENDELSFFVVEKNPFRWYKAFGRRGLLRAALSSGQNKVAYITCRSESCDLNVRQLENGAHDKVVATGAARTGQPSWNGNEQIVFEDDAGWIQIFDLTSQTMRRLVRGGYPSWSPDGRRLAYVAGKAVWVFDVVQGTSSKVYQRPIWESNIVGPVSWGPSDKIALNVAAGITGYEIECLILDFQSREVTALRRGYLWCGPWFQ